MPNLQKVNAVLGAALDSVRQVDTFDFEDAFTVAEGITNLSPGEGRCYVAGPELVVNVTLGRLSAVAIEKGDPIDLAELSEPVLHAFRQITPGHVYAVIGGEQTAIPGFFIVQLENQDSGAALLRFLPDASAVAAPVLIAVYRLRYLLASAFSDDVA